MPDHDREKFQFLPDAHNDHFIITFDDSGEAVRIPSEPISARPEPAPEPAGNYPCPCCGYLTFPVPKENAVGYICPVCFWENDVFDPGEDDSSDENRGMTLREGRENFKRWGAVREDLVQHTRPPEVSECPNPVPWDAAFSQQMKPSLPEIGAWVNNPLFEELIAWMGETYGVEPSVEFSRCSMDRGWNVKYKKGSKALCALYVRRGWFTAMVTLGAKQVAGLEALLPTFSAAFRKLYDETPPFNSGKWLVVDVKESEQLEEVQRLILLKAKPVKKQA